MAQSSRDAVNLGAHEQPAVPNSGTKAAGEPAPDAANPSEGKGETPHELKSEPASASGTQEPLPPEQEAPATTHTEEPQQDIEAEDVSQIYFSQHSVINVAKDSSSAGTGEGDDADSSYGDEM